MKDKYKPSQWTSPKKFWYMFLSVLAIVILCAIIGSLIRPDWEMYLLYPWLHELIAYILLVIIGGLTIFNFFLVIHLIYANQYANDKIKELEDELERVRNS